MTARMLLIFGVVSLSLVFGSRQYSSVGPTDAKECPSDENGNQSYMLRTESGEEVCVDGLDLGGKQNQKGQADLSKTKPLGSDLPTLPSLVAPHPPSTRLAFNPPP